MDLILAGVLLAPAAGLRPMDAPVPPPPPLAAGEMHAAPRALGQPITLFVNFDGIKLGNCNPSNSHKNCHWFHDGETFAEYSGNAAQRTAIVQAMRNDTAAYGIRVTSQRPSSSEDYVMVIYGGSEEEFGALGSAPSGDCGDAKPNEIAFAHLDGDLASWINGGATTALHEAAHTWGLDHVGKMGTIMFPAGDNRPTAYSTECLDVVENTDLDVAPGLCPERNLDHCNDVARQNADLALAELFGEGPYVDDLTPVLSLDQPDDGQYFQTPATFDVVIGVEDDLHPQIYRSWAWLDGQSPEQEPSEQAGQVTYGIRDLPVGEWVFHVRVEDEAGHQAEIQFSVEVGLDPPPEEAVGGCGCGTRVPVSAPAVWSWVVLVPVATRRRRR